MFERLSKTKGAFGADYDVYDSIIRSHLGYLLREMRKTLPEEEVKDIKHDVKSVLRSVGRLWLTEDELDDVRERCERLADRGRLDCFGLTGDAAECAQECLVDMMDDISAGCSREISKIRKKDGKDKGVQKILSGYEFWEK